MFRNWEFLIAEIWGHLLFAVVLTAALAWVLWGARARGQKAEVVRLKDDLDRAQTEMGAKEIELSRAFSKQEQLKDRMSAFQTKLAEAQSLQKSAEEKAAAHQSKLTEALAAQAALKQQLSAAQAKLSGLHSKVPENQPDADTRPLSLRERVVKGSEQATTWVKTKTNDLFGRAN